LLAKQAKPVTQAAPDGQHAWLGAPQAEQDPAAQLRPGWHRLGAQHCTPVVPHALHVPPVHFSHDPHVLEAQHGPPDAPHWTQVPPLQVSSPSSHALPQHTSPRPPQSTQLPPLQARPLSQESPAQHLSPAAPQALHVPPWQTSFGPRQSAPLQQPSPRCPHAAVTHTSVVSHERPTPHCGPVLQHACPAPPQAATTQVLPSHINVPAQGGELAQHG
jgi:hypothetical protein